MDVTFVAEPVTKALPAVSRSERFDALTGFRCLAACLVFMYHNRKYWRGQLHPAVVRLLNECHIGVSLFFVLSGFLIAYTYGEKPLQSGKAYGRYILLRMARILPLYWLILTCYYLDPPFSRGQFIWMTYPLVHGFSNTYNLHGLAQAWSLSVEFTFYLLAPLLCLLQRKHLWYLVGFLLALFGVACTVGYGWHALNGNSKGWFYPWDFVVRSTFFGRSTEFLAGMLLARAWRQGSDVWLQQWRYKTLAGFAGIFATLFVIGLLAKDIYHHGIETLSGMLVMLLVLPVFTVLTFAGLMTERTWVQRFFASRVMVFLGNASFAFYLVHISYVNMKIRGHVLLPDRNFVLLWMVAAVLYVAVENPVYMLCRRMAGKTQHTGYSIQKR